MYDIRITEEGAIDFSTGDAIPVSYSVFIAQKIYMAIMNMPMDTVTGTDETKPDHIVFNINGYFTTYFAYDLDINPNGFVINMLSRGNQRVNFSIEYNGTSPEGETIEVSSGYAYDIDAGTIRSVNYNPSWLELRESPYSEQISSVISVSSLTNEIELPLEPTRGNVIPEHEYDVASSETLVNVLDDIDVGETDIRLSTEAGLVVPDQDDINTTPEEDEDGTRTTNEPIVLCEIGKEQLSSTVEEIEFSITTDDRLIYPIGRYVEGYTEGDKVMLGATITSVPDGMIFSRTSEYGEEVVIVHEGTGIIYGTAYVITAKYATRSYRVGNPLSRNHVFKLRPVHGKFYAIFDKTVKTGDYVLKYKAYKEGRN